MIRLWQHLKDLHILGKSNFLKTLVKILASLDIFCIFGAKVTMNRKCCNGGVFLEFPQWFNIFKHAQGSERFSSCYSVFLLQQMYAISRIFKFWSTWVKNNWFIDLIHEFWQQTEPALRKYTFLCVSIEHRI